MKSLDIDQFIFSGDAHDAVKGCAEQVKIQNYKGRMLPQDKAEEILRMQNEGKNIAYVGDGINDAPALTTARLSIAMRHGASVALEKADLLALRDDPSAAAQTIRIAEKLKWITTENYLWAFGYNLILIPVAASGFLHPAFAALAMLLSSITVLANSARLLKSR